MQFELSASRRRRRGHHRKGRLNRHGQKTYPDTPDGRYFVVKGRLWHRSHPALDEFTRAALVKDLMAARRAVRDASAGTPAMADARKEVDEASHSANAAPSGGTTVRQISIDISLGTRRMLHGFHSWKWADVVTAAS